MYVGIDIGGTKTLIASLDDKGAITQKIRFETCQDYSQQLIALAQTLSELREKDFAAGAVGIPAVHIDRERGVGIDYSNLPWRDTPIQADLEKLCHCPIVVENDAKLAGLSEAMLLKDKNRVLYVTISTGIGYSLIINKHINTSIGDGGGRTLLLEHKGELTPWEDFASGRAIVARYGRKAKDITDKTTWQQIVHDLSLGFIELIAVTQPEVIVIGGSVGTHFTKYQEALTAALKVYETPLLPIPPLRQAKRPEEAVLFGCYDLAKEMTIARIN